MWASCADACRAVAVTAVAALPERCGLEARGSRRSPAGGRGAGAGPGLVAGCGPVPAAPPSERPLPARSPSSGAAIGPVGPGSTGRVTGVGRPVVSEGSPPRRIPAASGGSRLRDAAGWVSSGRVAGWRCPMAGRVSTRDSGATRGGRGETAGRAGPVWLLRAAGCRGLGSGRVAVDFFSPCAGRTEGLAAGMPGACAPAGEGTAGPGWTVAVSSGPSPAVGPDSGAGVSSPGAGRAGTRPPRRGPGSPAPGRSAVRISPCAATGPGRVRLAGEPSRPSASGRPAPRGRWPATGPRLGALPGTSYRRAMLHSPGRALPW